ncbi:MAG: mannose-1-phosphate guanylyltransferase [Chitinivibrionia bacterium]|nr:mannose-1-phosphate guanylyltransferase [Chitinivibrionia bacterium]
MSNIKTVPVILAGGIGERFWPSSRSSRPKQVLQLISEKLMIEETIERVTPLCDKSVKPLIVTGEKIAKPISDCLLDKYEFDMIVEPVGKNTAPAVAAAAVWCKQKYGKDSVMVVVSADHAIRPLEKFVSAAKYGVEIANAEKTLVVFGIMPTRAETGYGYIELNGEKGKSADGVKSFSINKFVEKPSEKKAKEYFSSGKYLWNSGSFIWKTSTIIEQFEKDMPDLFADMLKLEAQNCKIEAINEFYHNCIKESIDFGIMEKAKNVSAVEGVFEWDDIGAWEAMVRIHGKDENGNTHTGKGIFSNENKDCVIVNHSKNSVAVVGVKDVLVVNVDDAVLVISRDKLSDLKNYLAEMKKVLPQDLW